jgi:hypothetical protein
MFDAFAGEWLNLLVVHSAELTLLTILAGW